MRTGIDGLERMSIGPIARQFGKLTESKRGGS